MSKDVIQLPLRFSLPWPPSVNNYWRTVTVGRRNRTLISAEGRSYRRAVEAWVWERFRGRPPRFRGRLRVTLYVVVPDNRRRDLDNMLKAPLDAMEHAGLFVNDGQIDDLHIVRGPVEFPGRMDVVIESADDHPLLDGDKTTAQRAREETKALFK